MNEVVEIYALCRVDITKHKNRDERFYLPIKEANSLSELSRMDIEPGIFPAIFVSRGDVDRAVHEEDYEEGEPDHIDDKVARLTDQEMMEICSDLQDVYVEYGSYWDDLSSICEDLHDGDDGS